MDQHATDDSEIIISDERLGDETRVADLRQHDRLQIIPGRTVERLARSERLSFWRWTLDQGEPVMVVERSSTGFRQHVERKHWSQFKLVV